MTAIFAQERLIDDSQQRQQPSHQRKFKSQSHTENQHHKVIDIRIERQNVLDFRTQLIGREETECQRIYHKVSHKHPDKEHTGSYGQGFPDSFPLIRIKGRIDKTPDLKENIGHSRHYRHPESCRHMYKERSCQIDIDKLHLKLLRKKFISQIEFLTDKA